jgi:hypothetical protein
MSDNGSNNNDNDGSDNIEPLSAKTQATLQQLQRKNAATHSSNNNSNSPQLYHPSVFRYTCRGKLSLNSDLLGSAGTCRGIQSHLEHVDNWTLVTREEAIQVFSQQAASPTAAAAATADSSESNTAAAHAMQTALDSQVLIYPPAKNNGKTPTTNSKEDIDEKKVQPTIHIALPPSNSIAMIEQKWYCYGTTEVDLLVLRPQGEKEEQIAALAPYCSPGFNIRDIPSLSNPKIHDRTSTLRLGYVEVVYQNIFNPEDEDKLPKGTNNDNDLSQPASDEQGQPQPQTNSYGKKFFDSSGKIVTHMKLNANILKDAVSEDFPGRTLEASKRIVGEFGPTLDSMQKFGAKLAYTAAHLWDSNNGNDNDDHPKKGRGN